MPKAEKQAETDEESEKECGEGIEKEEEIAPGCLEIFQDRPGRDEIEEAGKTTNDPHRQRPVLVAADEIAPVAKDDVGARLPLAPLRLEPRREGGEREIVPLARRLIEAYTHPEGLGGALARAAKARHMGFDTHRLETGKQEDQPAPDHLTRHASWPFRPSCVPMAATATCSHRPCHIVCSSLNAPDEGTVSNRPSLLRRSFVPERESAQGLASQGAGDRKNGQGRLAHREAAGRGRRDVMIKDGSFACPQR